MKWISIFLIILIVPLMSSLTPVSTCGNLLTDGEDYYLTTNIESDTLNCITFMNSNINLDCNGFNITYAKTGNGNGIYMTGRENNSISNCNIYDGGYAGSGAGMSILTSNNINVENVSIYTNYITTTGFSSSNLYVSHSSGRDNSVYNFKNIYLERNIGGRIMYMTAGSILRNITVNMDNITVRAFSVNSPLWEYFVVVNVTNSNFSHGMISRREGILYSTNNHLEGSDPCISLSLEATIISNNDVCITTNRGIYLDKSKGYFNNFTFVGTREIVGFTTSTYFDEHPFVMTNSTCNTTSASYYPITIQGMNNKTVYLEDTIINHATAYPIRYTSAYDGYFRFLNSSSSTTGDLILSTSGNYNVKVDNYNYLDVNTSIENSEVNVSYNNGTFVDSKLTGENGEARFELKEYTIDETYIGATLVKTIPINDSYIYYDPFYNINATKENYNSTSDSNLNMSENKRIDLILLFLGVATCDCPTDANWIINDGSDCSLTGVCYIPDYKLLILNGSLSITPTGDLTVKSIFINYLNKLFSLGKIFVKG